MESSFRPEQEVTTSGPSFLRYFRRISDSRTVRVVVRGTAPATLVKEVDYVALI